MKDTDVSLVLAEKSVFSSEELIVQSSAIIEAQFMSFQPNDPHYEDRVRTTFAQQRFMVLLGAQLVAVRPGYCEIHLPYKEELGQQHGFFHAGTIGTIADNAAGCAASTLMGADSSVLTVEFKLNLLAPGKGTLLIARGHVIKPGRTLTVCQSDVAVRNNGEEKQCAVALITLIQKEL
jgi:uncharacterized protein (TIGR00369 family)